MTDNLTTLPMMRHPMLTFFWTRKNNRHHENLGMPWVPEQPLRWWFHRSNSYRLKSLYRQEQEQEQQQQQQQQQLEQLMVIRLFLLLPH